MTRARSILDEPANGLDPQGVHWLRNMLKMLAGQGRSIFVSSHLLSEMALMADHLVVIGRGSLIASGAMADFISTSNRNAVVVRVDNTELMSRELRARNATVVQEPDGRLAITGMDSDSVGGLAHELGIRVFELSNRQATLEEAFLDATGASEEFRASMGFGPTSGPGFGGPTAGQPGYGPQPVSRARRVSQATAATASSRDTRHRPARGTASSRGSSPVRATDRHPVRATDSSRTAASRRASHPLRVSNLRTTTTIAPRTETTDDRCPEVRVGADQDDPIQLLDVRHGHPVHRRHHDCSWRSS